MIGYSCLPACHNENCDLIHEFLSAPNMLGIGKIGLNRNSRNELKVLEPHVDLVGYSDDSIGAVIVRSDN